MSNQARPQHQHQPEKQHNPCDPLLTVTEVLARLRVARATWHRWRQTGQAPPVIKLPNGQLRVRRSALMAWLDAQEEPYPKDPP